MTTYFTADQHFGPQNIIGYCGRLLPATLDDHEDDTIAEHEIVTMLSPVWAG